ncbi:ABC transporter ATP-binding protein [Lampropedia puyangensis]|uniref:ABC transporter ATP-binding protein n=2 Tax=Lampropedia puyangensis TaxID=1330072 RepID=A0A4S8FJ02_9BURK|nr:ABC transporter ATP-binding protein [Lampropedia puyangensis]
MDTRPANLFSEETGFLSLQGLRKTFGDHTAVESLNLEIQQGEFISLLGPSGCGKTTTLHMIAGFIQPNAGRITLDGRQLEHVPSHQRGAAMVFQNYALFPHMSVFDNIAFGLRMAKVSKSDIATRVGRILELVRLDGLAKRYPRELSGGQQQRVALARALVLEPRLLLLDEPLSNLDAKLRQELRRDFVEIHRLTGMTTILVTHDLDEAFSTSDRVAILGHGRLQQFATPREIFTQPATRFVAAFVGHTNVLTGPVTPIGNGQYQLAAAMTEAAPPAALQVPAPLNAHSDHRSYAIPSHSLRLSVEGATDAAGINSVPAELLNLEYLGSTVQFTIRCLGQELRGEQAAGPWMDALQGNAPLFAQWAVADTIALPKE